MTTPPRRTGRPSSRWDGTPKRSPSSSGWSRSSRCTRTWWALLALAQYRCGRQGEALEALRERGRCWPRNSGSSPGPRLRELEQAILAQDPALDLDPRPPSAQPPARPRPRACPYKGLARYEIEDADSVPRPRTAGPHAGDRSRRPPADRRAPGRVERESPRWCGPACCRPSARGRSPAASGGAPLVVVPGARAVDTLAPLTGGRTRRAAVLLVCDQLEQLWSPDTSPGERVGVPRHRAGPARGRRRRPVRARRPGRPPRPARRARRPRAADARRPGDGAADDRARAASGGGGARPQAAGLTVEPDLTDVGGTRRARPLGCAAAALDRAGPDLGAPAGRRPHPGGLPRHRRGHRSGGTLRRAGLRSLSDEERHLARRILVRLAEQDEEGTLRARQLPVAELALVTRPGADRPGRRDASSLAGCSSRDGEHLEVAHEALSTAWPRLSAWLERDAVGRAVARHLAPAALEWAAHGRPADELYRGTRLEAAAQWVGRPRLGPHRARAGVRRGRPRPGGGRADRRPGSAPTPRRPAGDVPAGSRPARRRAGPGTGRRWRRRRCSSAGPTTGPPRPAPPARWPTPTGSRRSRPRPPGRSTSRCCSPPPPSRRPTRPPPATACSSALVEHRRATGVHQLSAEGIEETALSADGRTMAITIGGGSPRVMAWRPGSSAAAAPDRRPDWGPEHLAVSPDGDTVVGVEATSPRRPTAAGLHDRRGTTARPDGRGALGGYPGDVAFTDDGRLLMFVSEMAGASGRLSSAACAGRPGIGNRHHAEDLRPIRTRRRDGFVTSRQPSPTTPRRWSPGPRPDPRVPDNAARRAPGPAAARAAPRDQSGVRGHADRGAPALVRRGGHALRRPRPRGAGAGRAPGSRAGRRRCCPADGRRSRWATAARSSCGRSIRGRATGRSASPCRATPARYSRWRWPLTAGALLTAAQDGQLHHVGPDRRGGLRHVVPRPRRSLGLQPDRCGRPRSPGRRAGPDAPSGPGRRDRLGHAGRPVAPRASPRCSSTRGRAAWSTRCRSGRRTSRRRHIFGSSVAVSPDRRLGRGHVDVRGDRAGHADRGAGRPLPVPPRPVARSCGLRTGARTDPSSCSAPRGTGTATWSWSTPTPGGSSAASTAARRVGCRCSSGPRTGRRWPWA